MTTQGFRDQPFRSEWKAGDVLAVFGEVFERGYINGLIDEALASGLELFVGTVGRRDADQTLRPLTEAERATKHPNLINVPLEAGFDMELVEGRRPIDSLHGIKLSAWESALVDWDLVDSARRKARHRFRQQTDLYLKKLSESTRPDQNILVAHTMAGGVPRTKIVMPILNRVFKGYGDRFLSSEHFWQTALGRLCAMNFQEVTAETFRVLIEASAFLRERQRQGGGSVRYVAYGYHGTELLIDDTYRWQSYSPYLQGWAKLELENIARSAWADRIPAQVFNSPEILTNSSSIFLGIEVALYPLLGALRRERPLGSLTPGLITRCNSLLQDRSVDDVMSLVSEYFSSDITRRWSDFAAWPQHNGPEQMERMRTTSETLLGWHRDQNELLTGELSELVFRACGRIMFSEAFKGRQPVWWIGHDAVAKWC